MLNLAKFCRKSTVPRAYSMYHPEVKGLSRAYLLVQAMNSAGTYARSRGSPKDLVSTVNSVLTEAD